MKSVNGHLHLPFPRKTIVLSGGLALILLAASLLSGCGKIGYSIQIPAPGTARDECVVILHGMARTLHSMDKMQKRLTEAGYHTVNVGYPSTGKTVEEIATDHFPEALLQCQQFQPSLIHFVSHSLGALVLRTVFKDQKPEKLGRVVMLSPPNHGSEAADVLRDWWFYEWLNGPAGQQLRTDEASLPNQLGPVDYPVGIITGDRFFFFDFWFSSLIPGHDDGKVSVDSARLEGMHDFLVVHETHPFIMDADYVQEEALHFLENGTFRHQQPPLSPVPDSGWLTFPSK